MNLPDFPDGKSPKREIQGPRPTPLKVRKDSHKIKKPPMAPPAQPYHQQPPPHHRPPVIIYTVSPKVIHTDPSEFMTLVQRLTGSTSSSSSSSATLAEVSPAARFASIEKTHSGKKKEVQNSEVGIVGGMDISTEIERSSLFPGILSPGPAALPSMPSNFFSPPSEPNPLSFFHDLSPGLQGNRNFVENSFLPSPSNFFNSPHIISPGTPSLDLFNNFFGY